MLFRREEALSNIECDCGADDGWSVSKLSRLGLDL